MQLRYREKEKGFIILKEFYPSPTEVSSMITKGNKSNEQIPSRLITKNAIEEARKFLIMTGTKGETCESLKEIFGTLLTPKKLDGIEKIEVKDNKAKIFCKSENVAKNVFETANKRQVGEFKFNISTYF